MEKEEKQQSRRSFLTQSALIAGGSLLGQKDVVAQKKTALGKKVKFKWNLVMDVPGDLPIWAEHVKIFARHLKVMTDGEWDITVYGAGEKIAPLKSFEYVQKGKIEMAHTAPYYWQDRMPAVSFFTSIPFGMDPQGVRAWLEFGGGQQLWDKLYSPYGVKSFPAGNTGMQMGGWFNREINKVSDYKDLRMRIPGLGGRVIEKLGGRPVLVTVGDIMNAFKTGKIDAAEWIGPYHDYIMGFHNYGKYYYYPGWQEPGTVLELIVNKKAFNSLPRDFQEILDTALAELDMRMSSHWLAKDSAYLQKIKREGKAQLKRFPDEVLRELYRQSLIIIGGITSQDKFASFVYDSYREFRHYYDVHQSLTMRSFYDSVFI